MAVGHADRDRIDGFVGRLGNIDDTRVFGEMKRVHIFIQAVGRNTLRRTAQPLPKGLNEKVVLSQMHEHDPLPGSLTSQRAAFHNLARVPCQPFWKAVQDGQRGIQRRVAAATGKNKINSLRKRFL